MTVIDPAVLAPGALSDAVHERSMKPAAHARRAAQACPTFALPVERRRE